MAVQALCAKLNISKPTYYKWKQKHEDMDVSHFHGQVKCKIRLFHDVDSRRLSGRHEHLQGEDESFLLGFSFPAGKLLSWFPGALFWLLSFCWDLLFCLPFSGLNRRSLMSPNSHD
jgi:hypothetical protein